MNEELKSRELGLPVPEITNVGSAAYESIYKLDGITGTVKGSELIDKLIKEINYMKTQIEDLQPAP